MGAEFQINSYTTGSSYYGPTVASDANGGFVVVWEGFDPDGGGPFQNAIYDRRYSGDGTPADITQFKVTAGFPGYWSQPSVARSEEHTSELQSH